MNQELEIYYKSLGDSYSLAFDDTRESSIALDLIKGIAMDFEFDILKYVSEQIAKGNTPEEKARLRVTANEKAQEKSERLEIMRNAIKSLERLVGREEGIRAFVRLKNTQHGKLLDKIRELELKVENMEIYIAKDGE